MLVHLTTLRRTLYRKAGVIPDFYHDINVFTEGETVFPILELNGNAIKPPAGSGDGRLEAVSLCPKEATEKGRESKDSFETEHDCSDWLGVSLACHWAKWNRTFNGAGPNPKDTVILGAGRPHAARLNLGLGLCGCSGPFTPAS
jgi:hypothetical protein